MTGTPSIHDIEQEILDLEARLRKAKSRLAQVSAPRDSEPQPHPPPNGMVFPDTQSKQSQSSLNHCPGVRLIPISPQEFLPRKHTMPSYSYQTPPSPWALSPIRTA